MTRPDPARPDALARELKLKHLRLIAGLDDHRKLGRAAAALNLSQPAASKMLAEIEKIVGAVLFERLARGIEPTWYGEVMIRHARTVLAGLGQAAEEIAALKAGKGGSVAVGAVMAPAVDAVIGAVTAVRRRLPALDVTVEVETSDVLLARLQAAQLDFIIARIASGANPDPFSYREVGIEEICLMVRAEHPLAGRDVVRPSDLADCDWVLQPRGSLLRRAIEAMLLRSGLPAPTRVLNTGSILMTVAMAANTDAIAPLAVSVAEMFLSAGRFRILNFAERVTVEPFGLIRLKHRPLSPGAQALYDAVQERLYPAAPYPQGAAIG